MANASTNTVPETNTAMFEPMAASAGNAVMLPFPVWREVFVSDADMRLAESSFAMLNPHPYRTFTDRISLRRSNPPRKYAASEFGWSKRAYELNALARSRMSHAIEGGVLSRPV